MYMYMDSISKMRKTSVSSSLYHNIKRSPKEHKPPGTKVNMPKLTKHTAQFILHPAAILLLWRLSHHNRHSRLEDFDTLPNHMSLTVFYT